VPFDRSNQGFVAREESAPEPFGQSHIGRVVGREVGPELEDASEQVLVPRSTERQIEVVTQGLGRPVLCEVASEKEPTEGRSHFDVTERRDMQ